MRVRKKKVSISNEKGNEIHFYANCLMCIFIKGKWLKAYIMQPRESPIFWIGINSALKVNVIALFNVARL